MTRKPPRRMTKRRTPSLRLARSFFERNSGGGPSGSPAVVGLGNPGRSYERTRHNAGYLVVDELARRYGGTWRKKKRAEVAEISIGPQNVTLVKPTTYMNDSGSALIAHGPKNLTVVHDELDLPRGDVRVKVGGGAGGHNGLRSTIQSIGPDFTRVRIGIGRPEPDSHLTVTDFLLNSRMDPVVKDAIPAAADAVEFVVENGAEAAMNRFNVRSA